MEAEKVLIFLQIFFLLLTNSLQDSLNGGVISITQSNLKSVHYAGDLIFADEFDTFNLETWKHESTLGGSSAWTFQMYVNSRKNSYVRDGIFYLKPTLTSDTYGVDYLYNGQLSIHGEAPDDCTNEAFYGCARAGHYPYIVNPAMSAKITTKESFYFTYGRIEIKAKLPGGDWMWPSIILKPRHNFYGTFPSSGQCDLIQSRGNRKLFSEDGRHIGTELVTFALHFGPPGQYNGFERTYTEKRSPPDKGFDKEFHVYGLNWTDGTQSKNNHMTFSIDGEAIRSVNLPDGGFWEFGQFDNSNLNPWLSAKNKRMAPYDQKFYFSINVAVGGTDGFFPDTATNQNGKKPWNNWSDRSPLTFWEGMDTWNPTWQGDDAALQIDYIRVYAI